MNETPQIDKGSLNHFSDRILDRKSVIIGLRLSPREIQVVRELARAKGQDLSKYVRESILHSEASNDR